VICQVPAARRDPPSMTHETRHPNFVTGCDECMGEAVHGSIGTMVVLDLPGSSYERTATGATIFYEGRAIFNVGYVSGAGMVLPADVGEVIDRLRERAENDPRWESDDPREEAKARKRCQEVWSWTRLEP
jgi:hypothetical protein